MVGGQLADVYSQYEIKEILGSLAMSKMNKKTIEYKLADSICENLNFFSFI